MLAEGILIFWMRDVVKGPPEAGGISDETPLRFSPGFRWIWKPLLAALSQFLSISKESQRTQIAFPSASGGIRWKKVIVVVASSSPLSS